MKRLFAKQFLPTYLLASLFCWGFAPAEANDFSYRGELGTGFATVLSSLEPPDGGERITHTSVQGNIHAHLEVEYAVEDFTTFLVLDPSVTFTDSQEAVFDEGLTEAYARFRRDDIDLSIGLERLPLESARLNVPFSLTVGTAGEASDPKAFFNGIWGARALWFPGDFRVQGAVFLIDDKLGAHLGAKRFFGDFELETNIVYKEHVSFGIGGSGLAGNVVLYGESWLLLEAPTEGGNETSLYALLGASGFLDDALWTAEGGYFPLPAFLSARPISAPQAAAQISIPQGEAGSWNLTARVANLDTGLGGSLGATFSISESDSTTSINTNVLASSAALIVTFGMDITGFF